MYIPLNQSCTKNVQDLIKKWQIFLQTERRLSPLTCEAYLRDLTQAMSFFFNYKEKIISEKILENFSITDFRAFLVENARQNMTRSSIARHLSTLKNFFLFLSQQEILENTAIKSVRASNPNKILPKPLSEDEAFHFLNEAKKLAKEPWQKARDLALYTLLYGCGLRISEALALDIKDFPLNHEVLIIKGKGNKERIVPLLPFVKKVLKKYLSFRTNASVHEPLFIGNRGGRINPGVVQRDVRTIRRLLNLPDTVTPHALRHSFATHILAQSGDLRAVQELLGHKSLAATQRYTEIDISQLKETYLKAHPRANPK